VEAERLSQNEIGRYLWLRATEWANWPAFLSQLFFPVMLVFWKWYVALFILFVVSAAWCLFRYTFVSPRLANFACIAVTKLKWPISILCSVWLLYQKTYVAAALALLWPFLAGFVFFGGQVGRIQTLFLRKTAAMPEAEVSDGKPKA
jgi:hypothetical protein